MPIENKSLEVTINELRDSVRDLMSTASDALDSKNAQIAQLKADKRELVEALKQSQELVLRCLNNCDTPASWSLGERDAAIMRNTNIIAKAEETL